MITHATIDELRRLQHTTYGTPNAHSEFARAFDVHALALFDAAEKGLSVSGLEGEKAWLTIQLAKVNAEGMNEDDRRKYDSMKTKTMHANDRAQEYKADNRTLIIVLVVAIIFILIFVGHFIAARRRAQEAEAKYREAIKTERIER